VFILYCNKSIIQIAKEKIEQRSFDGWNMSLVNEKAFQDILNKYVKNEEFNPYFLDKETILAMLQGISKIM